MQRTKSGLSTTALLVASLSSASAIGFFCVKPVAAQSPDDHVIYLDQGWTQAERATYYQISQGSTVLDYNIFLNLEVADGEALFRSDANSDRYGMTIQPANPQTNPDGLPVGLSKTVTTEGPWKGEQVGLTCAACHNTEITYQGKRIRIDGGAGNHFDMMAYIYGLDDALQATLTDQAKFDRLADRIGASSPDAKRDLRKRFETQAGRVHQYRTRTLVTPVPWGPGALPAWMPSV
jgi:hypothetical protein